MPAVCTGHRSGREVGCVDRAVAVLAERAAGNADADLREAAVEHDRAGASGLFIQPCTIDRGRAALPVPQARSSPSSDAEGTARCRRSGMGEPASWSSSPSASSRRACWPAARERPRCSRSGPQPCWARMLLIDDSTDRAARRLCAPAVEAPAERARTAVRRTVARLIPLTSALPGPASRQVRVDDQGDFGRIRPARGRLEACPWPAARAGCPASLRVAVPASARAGTRSRRSCSDRWRCRSARA